MIIDCWIKDLNYEIDQMHTILIPYDFSSSAQNAGEYAMSLFSNRPSRFVIVHAANGSSSDIKALESKLRDAMHSLSEQAVHPHHEFVSKVIEKEVIEGILTEAKSIQSDVIIMGTKGTHDIQSRILGSSTSGVIEKTSIPLLAIPQEARYKGFRSIALATDYSPIINYDSLDYLMRLVNLSNAEFKVVNVEDETKPVTMKKVMAGVIMDRSLSCRPHKYDFVSNSSKVHGLIDYVRDNDVELLAMLKHDHHLLDDGITESVVGKTVLEIECPLLSLPDHNI